MIIIFINKPDSTSLDSASMEVVGERGLYIIDLRNAVYTRTPFSVAQVRITYLTPGDRFDPVAPDPHHSNNFLLI